MDCSVVIDRLQRLQQRSAFIDVPILHMLSLKESLDPKSHVYMFSKDNAWPTELLRHFVFLTAKEMFVLVGQSRTWVHDFRVVKWPF